MSSRAAVALVLAIAVAAAGAIGVVMKPRRDRAHVAPSSAPRGSSKAATARATSNVATTTSAGRTIDAPRSDTTSDEDRIEEELKKAQIEALQARGDPAGGLFDATITIPGRAGREAAELSIALIEDPYVHRRPLAFYRLAKAIGAHVVPATVPRRVGAGELASLVAGDPNMLAFVQAHASIQNDGTIDALLQTPGPLGGASTSVWRRPGPNAREIAMSGAPEIEVWAAWARSTSPAPSESKALLRGYVEMLMLDYLSANAVRRSAMFDEASGSITLVDNTSAFPLHWDAAAEAQLLARLRDVQRFPKGSLARLARFDKAAAAAALTPGGFEKWLVSPRNLVALDERRASLMSLIEARIAESTEAVALSL